MSFQFHETVMGHEFYQQRVPRFIRAIEKNNEIREQELAETRKLTEVLEEQCRETARLRKERECTNALLEEQCRLLRTLLDAKN